MKKILLTTAVSFLSVFALGQAFTWTEGFDDVCPTCDSTTTVFNGTHGFALNSRIFTSPNNCDTAYLEPNDTIDLRTIDIDFGTNTYAILSFDHICKVNFFDIATLDISIDGGASWFNLTNEYFTDDLFGPSPNSSFYEVQGFRFNETSWGQDWLPGQPGAIPANSWWKRDYFDLSGWLGAGPNYQIRWSYIDEITTPGGGGSNGWAIDNIKIEVLPCEPYPPTLVQTGIIWQNTIYNLGPYNVQVNTDDQSGIFTVFVYYSINGGPLNSIPMMPDSSTYYSAQLPAVNPGDTVCYYFVATDASPCENETFYPATGCIQFIALDNIAFPYCDNFDTQNLWTDSTATQGTGSPWELGTPAFGATTGANSPPNAWDIALNTTYLPSTNAFLYTPIFGNPAIGSKLSFWLNYNCETNFDGTRLEYSTDGSTWQILGDFTNSCGCQTNWYTDNSIICSGQAAWAGNSGGWVKSEYEFTPTFPFGTSLQFRFVFCSDPSVQWDGFSIDDFCIIEPAQFDAGVSAIIQPTAPQPVGTCQDVIVQLENFGIDTLFNFDVYFRIDTLGGSQLFGPFAWSGVLATGATEQDTFPCFNFPIGQFNLCAYTDLTNDGNPFNDTTCITLTGVPTLAITHCDDLESGNIGYLTSSGNINTTWQLGTPAFGQTTGAHSGTNAWDVNLATAYTTNSNCTLTTPFYNIQGAINPSFSFWQNRNINANDGMFVQYNIDNSATWTTLWDGNVPSLPGTAQNWYTSANFGGGNPGWNNSTTGWIKCIYYLDDILAANPAAQTIRFRFRFISGTGTPQSGISIDDICVTQPQTQDAGVISITTPVAGTIAPVGTMSPVEISFQNFGTLDITATDITWAVNGVPQATTSWTGTLTPGSVSPLQTLNGNLTYIAGNFQLCAYTQLVSDADTTNDTTCISLIGLPIMPLTNCDDLETTPNFYLTSASVPGTSWQLGTPAYGQTTGAHSGTQAWDVNLNTPYNTSSTCTLRTSLYDIVGAVNPSFSFWQNRNLNPTDGMFVQYSLNAGSSWATLWDGSVPALPGSAKNWYNTTNIGNGNPGWNNSTSGWIQSIYYLDDILAANPTAQTIGFRFIFSSGLALPLSGISIDDICVTQPGPQDAGVISINNPVNGAYGPVGTSVPVSVLFQNFGAMDITATDITWAINGVPQATTSWTGTLTPGSVSPLQNLNGNLIYIAGPFQLCAYTQLVSDGDLTNDTTCINLTGIPSYSLSFTSSFCDDFESGNTGWLVINNNPASASVWELGAPAFGITTGANSGSNAWDVNLNSAYTPNANVTLMSPFFDMTNAVGTKLSFWRNHFTQANSDGTRLEYSINGGPWTLLGAVGSPSPLYFGWYGSSVSCSGPAWNGNSGIWVESQMNDLGQVGMDNATSVQFRFTFCSNATINNDGFSIDDFCLEVPVPLTASPVTIGDNAALPLIFEGQPLIFNADLMNKGTTPLTTLEAQLWIDGALVGTDLVSYSPALTIGNFQNHAFTSNIWPAVAGTHDICVITANPNSSVDLNPTDDTICYSILVLDTVSVTGGASYCDNFDSGLPQWASFSAFNYSTNTSWEMGTPNKPTITGAHSPPNAWVTKLVGSYPPRDTSALFTPAFTIDAANRYKVDFWHMYNTEVYNDGGTMEYSLDFGTNWKPVGYYAPLGGTFWFNSPHIISFDELPTNGWSGNTAVYLHPEWNICFWPGSAAVIFRFRFQSDPTVEYDGWAIDDFCITDLGTVCPTGIAENSSQLNFSMGQNYPNPANGLTTIEYYLPGAGDVTFSISDLTGQQVAGGTASKQMAGNHSITINTEKLSPGIYFYSLTYENSRIVRKMIVVR